MRPTQLARDLRHAATPAEQALWQALRDRRFLGLKFVRQAPIGPCVVDFLCRQHDLVIEVDGGIHDADSQRAHDEARTAFLESRGLRVLRLRNEEVLGDLDGALAKVRAAAL